MAEAKQIRSRSTGQSQGTATSPKREAFAVAFVEMQSATGAYRAEYDCTGMLPSTVRQRAYELRHSADVAARIRALYDEAAKGTTISARARMVRLQNIIDADP